MIVFDRTVFFNAVRDSLFSGKLAQSQVDGMNYILDVWENAHEEDETADLRYLAYPLATTYHETGKAMQPIEEYGKGSGKDYGKPDPTTGQTYYGRGYVQLTWADNYKRADKELELSGDKSCYWTAKNALDPELAAAIMFEGMEQGWFRSGQTLGKYFNDLTDDPYGAREIINGDKKTVPEWSNGVSIGDLCKGYHKDFLAALNAAVGEAEVPVPEPAPDVVMVTIEAPANVKVEIKLVQPERAAQGRDV